MTHCLPSAFATSTPAATPFARRLPRLVRPATWSPTVAWIAGVAVSLSAAVATLPATVWAADSLPPPMAAAVTPLVADSAHAAPVRTRCAGCGVVESIRRVAAVGTEPAGYEFVVRLRDGSARASTVVAATAAAWAVGDPIILIGGI